MVTANYIVVPMFVFWFFLLMYITWRRERVAYDLRKIKGFDRYVFASGIKFSYFRLKVDRRLIPGDVLEKFDQWEGFSKYLNGLLAYLLFMLVYAYLVVFFNPPCRVIGFECR